MIAENRDFNIIKGSGILLVSTATRAGGCDQAQAVGEENMDMMTDTQSMKIHNQIVQSLTEGVIIIDFTGTIRYANPMAYEILGIEKEKLLGGKFVTLFLAEPENDSFAQAVLDTIYDRSTGQSRIVDYHTGSQVKQLRMMSSLFMDEEGNPAGITIVLSDLSELMELKDSLKAMEKISALNRRLDKRNKLLSKTFGQFLSDEIVSELLDTSGAPEPGGKKRTVTVMMSDLRGFTAMSERMEACSLISMLNHYLAVMTDAIQGRGGTIIEFLGDGIFAIFGAPVYTDTHAADAVAAALEMQAAMDEINRWNAEHQYPRLEMGIGLDTGETIVGIIGSEKRMKYGAIGSHVNQCGRIESYTTGGQVLISQSVREAVGIPLEIDKEMTVLPKGMDKEIVLSHVTGIGAPYDVHVAMQSNLPDELEEPVPVCFYRMDGKHIIEQPCYGGIIAAGRDCAFLETETQLELLENLQIQMGGRLLCKVMEKKSPQYLLQYTAIPFGYDEWIREHRGADLLSQTTVGKDSKKGKH